MAACEKIYWKALNGSLVDLTDGVNYMALPKRAGFWYLKNEFSEADVPEQAGRKLLHVHVQERDIDLTMLVQDGSPLLLRQRMRLLNEMLLASGGDGQLMVEDESGAKRVLRCRYQSGVEKAEEGFNYLKFVLNFRAHDPYWYAENESSSSFSSGGETASWFPIFPLNLVSSSVFGEAVISNPGDVETWPVFRVEGPGGAISVINRTTEYMLGFKNELTLAAGDVLTVDTRPGVKTCKKNGADVFSYLTGTSVLFPLVKGDNVIRVRMANTTGESLITVAFTARFSTP